MADQNAQLFIPIQRWTEFSLEIVDFQVAVSPTSQVVLRDCTATYQVSFPATGTPLANALQLSVSGQPEGVMVEFSTNPVHVGDTPTVTIRTSETAPAGVYQLRLTAVPMGV